MIEWISVGLVALLGVMGVVAAIAWPIEQRRDPYAAPFGDLPKLPSGSMDRGDRA